MSRKGVWVHEWIAWCWMHCVTWNKDARERRTPRGLRKGWVLLGKYWAAASPINLMNLLHPSTTAENRTFRQVRQASSHRTDSRWWHTTDKTHYPNQQIKNSENSPYCTSKKSTFNLGFSLPESHLMDLYLTSLLFLDCSLEVSFCHKAKPAAIPGCRVS